MPDDVVFEFPVRREDAKVIEDRQKEAFTGRRGEKDEGKQRDVRNEKPRRWEKIARYQAVLADGATIVEPGQSATLKSIIWNSRGRCASALIARWLQ